MFRCIANVAYTFCECHKVSHIWRRIPINATTPQHRSFFAANYKIKYIEITLLAAHQLDIDHILCSCSLCVCVLYVLELRNIYHKPYILFVNVFLILYNKVKSIWKVTKKSVWNMQHAVPITTLNTIMIVSSL